MACWTVMYGHGRAFRARSSGGGISYVRTFPTELEAIAFAEKCKMEGMRLNVCKHEA